ncbi:MAG: tetratricopeptide repeat protein [Candidatus Omnitrophota bacterium]
MELTKNACRDKNIGVQAIDISEMGRSQNFETLLRKSIEKLDGYRVLNILGVTRHVKVNNVSSFFNHMNLIRERLAADFPYSFFFWLPENLISRFTLDAPDLWAWRNTVLVFEDSEMESIIDLIPIQTYIGENFERFTKKEQETQFDYLRNLLIYLEDIPESSKKKKRLSQIYDDLGKMFCSMKEYSTSLLYYKRSLELLQDLGDVNGMASVYNNMALTYQANGDYDNAFKNYQESMDILSKSNDPGEKASIYNNMGILFRLNGKEDLAFQHFRESNELFLQSKNWHGIGATVNNIGIIHEFNRNFNAALEAFNESKAVFEKSQDELASTIVLNNIGHVYYSRGDYDAAADCLLNRAMKLEKLGFKPKYVLVLYKLSKLFKEAEQEEEHIKFIRRAFLQKRELGNSDKDMSWEGLEEKYSERCVIRRPL